MKSLLSRNGHRKSTWNGQSFLVLPACIKRTPVIKLHHLILPDIMDKRTLRWPPKARQPTCSRKWSLRVKMLEQSWNWWLLSLEIMLYVHCNSKINSIEKDTVYIQFYDCLYKYTACFVHLFSLTVCSIVFCLSHFVFFNLCRTYFTHASDFFKTFKGWICGAILCLWYYDKLVPLKKEINANVYRRSICIGVFQTFPPFIWIN